jgi:MFS family permease
VTGPSSSPSATDAAHPVPLLRLPLMRGLTVAQFMSSIGTAVVTLAIAFLSYDDSKSILHTVLVSAAYSLPTAVLGMYAGRLAGRESRRQMLLVLYGLKGALYLVMAVLAAADTLKVPELMVTSVLAGTLAAFATPAWMEFERDVVPADRLDEANALFGAATSSAVVLGAVIGAVLLGSVGPWAMFVVNALSYLGFVWVLVHSHPQEAKVMSTHRTSLREAIRYIGSVPALRRMFTRVALLSLFVAPVTQLLPAVARELSESKASLGVLTGAFAVGAIVVAHVIGRLKARHANAAILNLTFLISGIVLVLFGRTGDALGGRTLWVTVLASLIPLGLLLSLAQSVLTGGVERLVTTEMEGAVFSLYAIVYTILAPLGGLVLAQFADHYDVWDALTLAGAIVVVGSLVALVFWRHPVDGSDTGRVAPSHAALDGLLRGHLLHLHAHRRRPSTDSTEH